MQREEEAGECVVRGALVREGSELCTLMVWHLDHSLSEAFRRDFLMTRCKVLQSMFGVDLHKVQGVAGIDFEEYGIRVHLSKKVVDRHEKTCAVSMGFVWPGIDDKKWEDLKAKFKEVFAPAVLHGEAQCSETNDVIHIKSRFHLAEKGGN